MMIIVYLVIRDAMQHGSHFSHWLVLTAAIFAAIEAFMYLMIVVSWIIGIVIIWKDRL